MAAKDKIKRIPKIWDTAKINHPSAGTKDGVSLIIYEKSE
jgi:hypothetical protein